MRPDFDVAVVGAGPCGSVAARDLARGGARVLLLERAHLPRAKTCGGGIVGRTRRWLGELSPLAVERECRAVELSWMGAGGLRFRVERAQPIMRLAMRDALDQELVREAAASGSEVRDGTALLGVEADTGGVCCVTDRGSFSARALIAADGAFGVTARLAGLDERLEVAPALECELSVDAATMRRFADAARFDFEVPHLAAPGYAWMFPKRAHLSIGVLAIRAGRCDLRAALAGYADFLGLPDPTGPSNGTCSGHVIPARPRRLGFARGPLLVAGDAAGLAEPVTFEGISFAAWSGALAAQALLSTDRGSEQSAARYEELLRLELLPELAAARSFAGLLYGRPELTRVALRARGDRICEFVVDAVSGRSSFLALRERIGSPAAWARLALGG